MKTTVLLARWKPAFAWLPVENMVWKRQQDYYTAIETSTRLADSGPFIQLR